MIEAPSSSPQASPSPQAALPPGWTAHIAPDNSTYYYHAESNLSSWTPPTLAASTSSSATAAATEAFKPPPPTKRARSLSTINEALVQASPMRHRAQLESFKEELQEKLSQRDGILEPDVEHTLRQWISVSEELGLRDYAKEATAMLSQNYAGSGDLAAILESWLDIVKPGLGKATSSAHLREMIRQRFDRSVEALDELLIKYERPPVWLAALLENKNWRALFIELAAKHRSSPFLSFCVRAVALAGFYGEVTDSLSASSHFSVFKETLAEALATVMQAVANGESSDACLLAEAHFLKMADSTLHANAYAVELLLELEKPSRGLSSTARAVATRLRQKSQTPRPMDPLIRRSNDSMALTYPEVAQILKRIAHGETDFASDAASPLLYKSYSSELNIPTWPLREKHVLDHMVGSLFQPYKAPMPTEQVRQNASWVLALAASDSRLEASAPLLIAVETASLLCNDEESLSLAKMESCIKSVRFAFVLEGGGRGRRKAKLQTNKNRIWRHWH